MQTAELHGNAPLSTKNSITYLWYQDTANSEPHYISNKLTSSNWTVPLLSSHFETISWAVRELLQGTSHSTVSQAFDTRTFSKYEKWAPKSMLYQNPLLKEFLWSSWVKHPSILNFSAFTVGHVICTHKAKVPKKRLLHLFDKQGRFSIATYLGKTCEKTDIMKRATC